MNNPIIFQEKEHKFWAIEPSDRLPTGDITTTNYLNFLRIARFGLGQSIEIALARLEEAIQRPRESAGRYFETSFVEQANPLGSLSIAAFSSLAPQPCEWLVEAFLDDEVVPTVHKIPMMYYPEFGVDQDDYQALFQTVDQLYPSNA